MQMQTAFIEFIDYIKQERTFDPGADPELGDSIITLATGYSVYHKEGRLIVLFRRIS